MLLLSLLLLVKSKFGTRVNGHTQLKWKWRRQEPHTVDLLLCLLSQSIQHRVSPVVGKTSSLAFPVAMYEFLNSISGGSISFLSLFSAHPCSVVALKKFHPYIVNIKLLYRSHYLHIYFAEEKDPYMWDFYQHVFDNGTNKTYLCMRCTEDIIRHGQRQKDIHKN